MSSHPPAADLETDASDESAASGLFQFIIRLPFTIAVAIAKAALYSAWYFVFFILCMFRPFTGFMMLTAVVMVPISITVYAHPGAANGMPFWAFGLMAIGLVTFAVGYTIFLDWFTPPGAEDPFARYRRRDR